MRRLRDAKTVPVSRAAIDRLVATTNALSAGRSRFNNAPDRQRESQAWAFIDRAIVALSATVEDLSGTQPMVRTDDIDDTDYTIN